MTRPEPDWLSLVVQPLGGYHAVQSFFVMSGFYMALIWTTKYGPLDDGARVFLHNRAMRLLPTYWLVAAATVAGYAIVPGWFYYARLPDDAACVDASVLSQVAWTTYNWLTVLIVVGQGSPAFGSPTCSWLLPTLMPLPQAWSLGVEALFYLATPWLVRVPTPALVGVVATTTVARALMIWAGVPFFPWQQRFPPLELGGFVLGIVAYRLFVRQPRSRRWGWVSAGVLWGGTVFWMTLAGPNHAHSPHVSLWLLPLVAALLPSLFALTGRWKVDRMIGELSYPAFLWHIVVLAVVPQGTSATMLIGLTLLLAALTVRIEAPIERWRQRQVRDAQRDDAAHARLTARA